MIELSDLQTRVLKNLLYWFENRKSKFITMGGYAGTGKTTIIALLRAELAKKNKPISVAFCAYTGKATRVLKTKLTELNAIHSSDETSTIHSLIYSPLLNDKKEIISWDRKESLVFDLIICDEASMIDEVIWRDLLRFGIPIIAVGDHGQLPPIRGSFNLMDNPVLKLEEIYRQAKDNPIIELSIMARTSGIIPVGKYGDNIVKLDKTDYETQERITDMLGKFNKETLVLCGYNTTRIKLNKFIRNSLGFETDSPVVKDRVICLKNNHTKSIYNGMLGTIKEIDELDEELLTANIDFDNEALLYKGIISKRYFNSKDAINKPAKEIDYFDFGYAITVHKAQGSQAKRVILFEERFPQMDDDTWKRWLYTAITRAEEELFIVG